MDSRTPEEVEADIATIKREMPRTYEAIRAKAAEMGDRAFALVRRGLRGEPNCFYAIEAGHVMGVPPGREHTMTREIAWMLSNFSCRSAVAWGPEAMGHSRPPAGAGAAHAH